MIEIYWDLLCFYITHTLIMKNVANIVNIPSKNIVQFLYTPIINAKSAISHLTNHILINNFIA